VQTWNFQNDRRCHETAKMLKKFSYFGSHFGFKMAAIANQSGRHMVEHDLLPVNIHFQ
jgi:hypothetical protein